MDESDIRNLLEAVKRGRQTIDSTVAKLRRLPYEDLGFAKVDHHRGLRQGYAEVVFARGKTPKQVAEIVRAMLRAKASHNILITRANKKTFAAVKPAARAAKLRAEFHELSGTISIERSRKMPGQRADSGCYCRDERHSCGGGSACNCAVDGQSRRGDL